MSTAKMAGWKDEYLAHLRDAEKNNPVNMEIVEACINPAVLIPIRRRDPVPAPQRSIESPRSID